MKSWVKRQGSADEVVYRSIRPMSGVAAAFLLAVLVSCATRAPAPADTPPPVPTAAPDPKPAEPVPVPPKPFDPAAVSAETKAAAVADIKALIEKLNTIIQRKDYDAWLLFLTEEYKAYYTDPAVLGKISEYPVLKRAGIKLNSLKDYFAYVVFPSRQNDRVDDIEYLGASLVKAITVSPKGERQILYNLEKHGDTWKIGIGR
ncbi:MAG: hypothetical protein JNG85_07290 [Spirochaetaceae bacterium]|nr:hypothetical protein [Spirochaetaceae bacterium]